MIARLTILFALIGALGAGVIYGNRRNAALKQEQEPLAQRAQEARRLARENARLSASRGAAEALNQLRKDNLELLALRNEVSLLQREKITGASVDASNGHATATVVAVSNTLSQLSEVPDFVAAESITHAGFATPEESLRSYFAAIRQGDLKQLLEALASPERDKWVAELATANQSQIASAVENLRNQYNVVAEGYRIAGKRTDGTVVVLFLQINDANNSEHLQPMTFVPTKTGWKYDEGGTQRLLSNPKSFHP